jgi:hypothetical protein
MFITENVESAIKYKEVKGEKMSPHTLTTQRQLLQDSAIFPILATMHFLNT